MGERERVSGRPPKRFCEVVHGTDADRWFRAAQRPSFDGSGKRNAPPFSLRPHGLGLRNNEVDEFVARCAPTYQGQGQDGVYEAVIKREGLDRTGRILGYDILGHEDYGGGFCSWFCNSLEETAAEMLGIRPDHNGLLSTRTDAAACAAYASDPDTHAEPASWNAWIVVDYAM